MLKLKVFTLEHEDASNSEPHAKLLCGVGDLFSNAMN
jgi:hypothetical protein